MSSTSAADKTLLDLIAGPGDRPALLAPGRPALTYAQLRANVVELAARLNSFGLGRGDRIAIAMGNGPDVVLAFLAAALCGTAAPLNPKYRQEEFAFYYDDIHARALITLPGAMPPAQYARAQSTENRPYTPHSPLAVPVMRGVSLVSFSGPAASALNSWLPPTPSRSITCPMGPPGPSWARSRCSPCSSGSRYC